MGRNLMGPEVLQFQSSSRPGLPQARLPAQRASPVSEAGLDVWLSPVLKGRELLKELHQLPPIIIT